MARKRQETVKDVDQPLTHEEDPILTLSEVGRQLGKHHTTIARWCHDGLLKALRIPGTVNIWGVRKSEVNKFLGASALDVQIKDEIMANF